jgi:hypothetical protein
VKRPEWDGEAADGFVATFTTNEGLVTLHRSNPYSRRSLMLAAAIDDVLARWPEARLVCYSTPQTILLDLRGRLCTAGGRALRFPEVQAASYARRFETLAPMFISMSRAAERLRGRAT